MSKGRKCPVCGHWTYRVFCGSYDEEGKKLEPEQGHCSYCGFNYMEHVCYSLASQARSYRPYLKLRGIKL